MLTMTEAESAFYRRIVNSLRPSGGGRETVTYTSRWKRYTFWAHKRGGRVLVRIRRVKRPRLPDVETLAEKLAKQGNCKECSRPFEFKRRRQYCSTRCATRNRVRRFRTPSNR